MYDLNNGSEEEEEEQEKLEDMSSTQSPQVEEYHKGHSDSAYRQELTNAMEPFVSPA